MWVIPWAANHAVARRMNAMAVRAGLLDGELLGVGEAAEPVDGRVQVDVAGASAAGFGPVLPFRHDAEHVMHAFSQLGYRPRCSIWRTSSAVRVGSHLL